MLFLPLQLAGAAFVGVFTPTVPVYVAILSAILRIERFTLLKVGQLLLTKLHTCCTQMP